MAALVTIPVKTHKREEMMDITQELQQVVNTSNIQEGILAIQVMHTTAAITINENADPDVIHDMLMHLEQMVPQRRDFRHEEGNSDAHIKSSLVGPTLTVHINKGQLVLGTWQGIYFCEFDGPRHRKVTVRVIG